MARIYLPSSVPAEEEPAAVETEPDEPVDVAEPTQEEIPVRSAPARNASKVDWVDYAVVQGADRADAEALTRDELADRYS